MADSIHQQLTKAQDRCRSNLRKANMYRLSKDSGISRTTLYRIRNGEVLPRAETIEAIDEAMQKGA